MPVTRQEPIEWLWHFTGKGYGSLAVDGDVDENVAVVVNVAVNVAVALYG